MTPEERKRLELELEYLNLEKEKAQAAQSATAASPFVQRSIGMVQEAMATPPPPQTRNTTRAADGTITYNKPGSKDRMSGSRQDTRIIVQAQRVADDIANATRKARVGPVERAAGEAGRAAMGEQWGDPMPFRESEFMLSPQETRGMQAERQVYRDADVTSSLDAATIRGANSLALGIPGIVNKDFRGELAAAGNDQPVASLAADVAGFLAPSVGMWNTGRAAVNAFARPFIPRGADAASRGVRYIAPRTGEIAGAAATNAAFQAGVQEPIRAEMAGEDLTLSGMGSAAKSGATDPLNLLPLGLSAVNRTWNAATSGIATPSARAAEMANRFGVGPRQTAASQGIAQTTQQLAGQVQPGDIAGFANIENMLRYALRDNPNIPDVNARIATGFERIRQSLPLADDPTLNLARLIEREFAEDAPQTRDVIRRFLLKVGMDTPGGGAIVGGAANEIRGQQVNNLRTEVESAFGAQPRIEANAAIQGSLDQFSQAYNTILPQAPRTGPQVDRALALLAREPQSLAILDDLAQSQNLTSEQFIERNPLQALHEVQSELARQARAGRASGADVGPLEITIRNMQRPLREGVPGYGDLQNLWRQWTQARERMGYVRGAEAGTAGELDMVPGFGEKVLGAGGVRGSEMGTQTAADTFLQMDDLSQRAAGLSVRDVISDELRKMRAAGVDQRYAAPARMAQVATEGGLDALRRVFGEAGDRVARRIEQFIDATEFARNIDPEFNSATMNKAQAMATGAQPFAGPLGQRAQAADSALSQSALADAALLMTNAPPILSIMRAPGIAARSLQPSQRTQQNIAQTLLRRGQIGSQVPPQAGGPPPIMPIDPAQVPGGGPPPSGGTPPPSGPPPQAPAPRTVGVAPLAAAPVGAPAPTTPIRTAGFGIGPNGQATLQQSALGSVGGSAYGSQNDVNGDGVIDEQDAYAGAFAGGVGLPLAAQGLRTVGQPRATSGRTVGAGLGDNPYFGRQSMRPPGSGPSPREIELRQQWSTATPIVTQARTTAQSAQAAADAALQSKAPADIARAKAEKKTLVAQLQEAQASRAGMDTPEDARLAETLASLNENTSDPVLLSTQISAAKTSLDRLLTDIGSPSAGNLIPVRTTVQTRTQAPRSAAEGPQDRPSVTRYAEGTDDVQPMGFGAATPKPVYGRQDIPEVAEIVANQLRARGVDVEISRSKTDYGVSFYIKKAGAGPQAPNIRISDHPGGYGERRLVKSYGFEIQDNTPAEEISSRIEATINRAEEIYDPASAGQKYQTQLAANRQQTTTSKENAKNAYLDAISSGLGPAKAEQAAQVYDRTFRAGMFNRDNREAVKQAKMTRNKSDDVQPMGFGASTPKTPATELPDYGYNELRLGKASVEVTRVEDKMTINRLKVPENARGQGEASKALDAVLQQADQQGITTFLKADPGDSAGGMTQPQLEAFYKSRGFVSDGADGMVRPPASRAAQAVRFETPGSPEYEAAVAKGLDMSQAGRMGRRKSWQEAAGTDPEIADTVLYHGTATDVASFDPRKAGGVTKARSAKLGTWLTGSPKTAEGYADLASGKPVQDLIDASYAAERAGQWDKANRLMAEAEALETAGTAGQTIMPLYVRGKLKTIDMDGVQYDPDDVNLSEIAKAAKQEGFDGIRLTNFSDEAGYGNYNPTTHVLIFDPSNIRSINAAFDPEKSGSSTLLAAAPFAAVSGAGLTLAGEDARNQRTVGKPKASQSARTVGKARTN